MSHPSPAGVSSDSLSVLAGGGNMGALMRSIDWSHTPIGPVACWPQSLRTVLSILLTSRHPIFVWWGPELIQFYNDAYRPILGATKHPGAMGQRGRECWHEIWDVIEPMIDAVMKQGEATFLEDSLLVLDRNGYLEECYFVYAYSPIRDEAGAVGGVFVACNETTSKVLGARRVRTLRDLADHTVRAASDEEACQRALEVLGDNRADVPFAALYLHDGVSHLRLTASLGTPASPGAFPELLALPVDRTMPSGPVERAVHAGKAALIPDVVARFGTISGGPWPEVPHTALAIPIYSSAQSTPIGVLLAGLSPRLPFDDDYRGFFDLVADHLGTAIAHARAAEGERRRAAALTELDRAKTAFFSNISHEFRTPLTLLLGPVEDALAHTSDGVQRERLAVVHRNAMRLQKLVNMLLDFSRIEAGRLQAVYVPSDLTALTIELAESFRMVLKQAGLALQIDCPPLSEPIYVDPDLYEKIVLNLFSNAFKYTLSGEVAVALREVGNTVELVVRDTGVGIAPEQLPHIFDRFHRVEGAGARTHEGTGIGLALVQELVRLHGGTISVQSSPGQGSTFTITLLKGSTHLPANRIGNGSVESSSALKSQMLEEIYGWSYQASADTTDASAEQRDGGTAQHHHSSRSRIVWADDNADMREFVRQLLTNHYDVVAVSNGRAALDAVRAHPPDLVLADVMMPELGGFGMVRALRDDPQTRTIPIILLSARAGEQSEVEGLEAGVDDYLTKPFSARELLARIQTHLHMARLRREASEALRASEERTRLALDVAQVGTWNWEMETDIVLADPRCRAMGGMPPDGPLLLSEIMPRLHPDDRPRIAAALVAASSPTGDGRYAEEFRFVHDNGDVRWAFSRGQCFFAGEGPARYPTVMIGTILDITARKEAEAALREAHDKLELRVAQRTAQLAAELASRQEAEQRLAAALAEKEVLLKEVHHRVKNNLQVIASLLRLQAANVTDMAVRELFRDSQSRVQAMALVHEQIYQSPDLGRVPFADYLHQLADRLLRFYLVRAGQIEVRYNLDPSAMLPLDTAVPLGLIMAELLSNSVKHAFPNGQSGNVTIDMGVTHQGLTLSVSDDGVGMPTVPDLEQVTTLGLEIVAILVEQLHASVSITNGHGTRFDIVIPSAALHT